MRLIGIYRGRQSTTNEIDMNASLTVNSENTLIKIDQINTDLTIP